MADPLSLLGFGQPTMVDVVHVHAIGDDFPAALQAGLHERRVALGDGGIDGDRRGDGVLFQRLHDAKNADTVAVVSQGVVAKIGVGRLHRARWLEGLPFHVQGKPFQCRNHPKGQTGALGPTHRWSLRQHGPGVPVVVHAVTAQGVIEVIVGQTHAASPTVCAAAVNSAW
jgi:hypothetical protein